MNTVKVTHHWTVDEAGDVVFEILIGDEQRFGFCFSRDKSDGWWFISKGDDKQLVIEDGRIPTNVVEALRNLLV